MIAEQDFFGKKNSVIATHTWSGSGRTMFKTVERTLSRGDHTLLLDDGA